MCASCVVQFVDVTGVLLVVNADNGVWDVWFPVLVVLWPFWNRGGGGYIRERGGMVVNMCTPLNCFRGSCCSMVHCCN